VVATQVIITTDAHHVISQDINNLNTTVKQNTLPLKLSLSSVIIFAVYLFMDGIFVSKKNNIVDKDQTSKKLFLEELMIICIFANKTLFSILWKEKLH
jgi:hypothetical protein